MASNLDRNIPHSHISPLNFLGAPAQSSFFCPLYSVVYDLNLWEGRNSKIKFLGVTVDENLNFNDHVNKVTIPKYRNLLVSWGDSIASCLQMYWSSCTILCCIPIWLMRYWHGEDRDVLMLLRLSALKEEHVNYSQIITKISSLFTQFMITLLYQSLSTQIP